MGTDSEELAIDLHNLLNIAVNTIPAMASQYTTAANSVAATAESDSGAFTGSVGARWRTLRDEFHDLLAQSEHNLRDTGSTLVNVVNSYAAEDEAASTELDRLVESEKDWYGDTGVEKNEDGQFKPHEYDEKPQQDLDPEWNDDGGQDAQTPSEAEKPAEYKPSNGD